MLVRKPVKRSANKLVRRKEEIQLHICGPQRLERG